jgi:RNA recognition motif-containing protein
MFTKLFVGGLPFVYSQGELKALFAPVGTVVSAEMVFDPDRGRTRGFGFVEMSTTAEAQAAINQLNGLQVGEKKIYVTQAREKPASRDAGPRRDRQYPPNRKVGRPDRAFRSDQPASDAISTPPFRFDNYKPAQRYKGSRGRGPSDGPRTPFGTPRGPRPDRPGFGQDRPPRRFGEGGPKGSGFSRPNKWEPRGDAKRSFSPPRSAKGDFGPSGRSGFRDRPGKPSSGRKNTGEGAKPKFWQKFAKKPPRRDR